MGAFRNILLETFVPNLVSVTLTQVSKYRAKLRWVQFRIFGQSLVKANCHNSRTSDIEMKLGPASKLDKKNKTTSKNWRWHCDGKLWCYCHFSDFWPTSSNPETGFWMHSIYIRLTFSLTVTFYLTKNENRTKISLTQLSQYCFE